MSRKGSPQAGRRTPPRIGQRGCFARLSCGRIGPAKETRPGEDMEVRWGAALKRRLALTVAATCVLAVAALPEAASAVLSGTNGRIVFVSGRAPFDNANGKLYLRLTTGSFGGSPTTA